MFKAHHFVGELIGTFILVFFIFSMTEGCNVGRPDDAPGASFHRKRRRSLRLLRNRHNGRP